MHGEDYVNSSYYVTTPIYFNSLYFYLCVVIRLHFPEFSIRQIDLSVVVRINHRVNTEDLQSHAPVIKCRSTPCLRMMRQHPQPYPVSSLKSSYCLICPLPCKQNNVYREAMFREHPCSYMSDISRSLPDLTRL